jgi:hypothetical protein
MVGHTRPRLIFNDYRKIIFYGNVVAKNAFIPAIPVELFRVKIKGFQIGVFCQVKRKGILWFRASRSPVIKYFNTALLRVLAAIEHQVAGCKHCCRPVGQPPVHQVKVMGGFMYYEAAGIPLVTVPAPEVIRTVRCIEQPLKMNRVHLANGSSGQQFLYLGISGSIAIVETDPQRLARLVHDPPDSFQSRPIDGKRFFGNDIATRLHRPCDVLVMGSVHAGYYDKLDRMFGNHQLKIIGAV